MKYHPRRLSNVYSFLLEGDVASSELSTILSMPTKRLGSYLRTLKNSSPEKYGSLVFRAGMDKNGRQKIIDALS